MRLRALATALALLAVAGPVAAQPDPLRERFVARLNASGNASLFALPDGVWEVMDSVVLRELRRGRTVDEVNRAIAGFPGYSGPSGGDGSPSGGGRSTASSRVSCRATWCSRCARAARPC